MLRAKVRLSRIARENKFMNAKTSARLITLGVVPLLLLSTGCIATRKFVRNQTEPLESHITKVDQKVDQKTAQLDQDIRSLDEKTEAGISAAQNSADKANQAAGQADQHAQEAHQVADKAVADASRAQETADNLDNYQPTQHVSVLFPLNKATLTDADKQQLDQLVQTVSSLKHYAIQVQGYTDTTGPKEYNLQLSQKRADAVIRYLTSNGKVPLVRIYSMGYGESDPVAPNTSLKGRKLNRRVDLTVLVPQLPAATAEQMPAQGQTSSNVNQ
jgi:outer membrane protein OmpA-like peptidoglycan-associated protein